MAGFILLVHPSHKSTKVIGHPQNTHLKNGNKKGGVV